MGISCYEEMRQHIGHQIACVFYGPEGEEPHNVAVECVTCGVVLFDFDHPDVSAKAEEDIPAPAKKEWTEACSAAARAQGWDLFETESPGYRVIQCVTERGVFMNDEDALVHVVKKARNDEICNLALELHQEGMARLYWLKCERKWAEIKKKDAEAKAAGRLVGRYITESYADGYAYYEIVAELKTKVRIKVITGIGDDWVLPAYGEETTIKKQYARDNLARRDVWERVMEEKNVSA